MSRFAKYKLRKGAGGLLELEKRSRLLGALLTFAVGWLVLGYFDRLPALDHVLPIFAVWWVFVFVLAKMWRALRQPEDALADDSWTPILRGLVFAQITMAASAAAFLYLPACLLSRTLDPSWYIVAFCGTLWVYLLDAGLVAPSPQDKLNFPDRLQWVRERRIELSVLAVAAATGLIATLVLFQPQSIWTWFLITVLAIIGTAYPFLRGAKSTASFGLLKPFFISLGWLFGTVSLVLLEGSVADLPVAAPTWAILLLLLGLLWSDSTLLDLCDREGDKKSGIKTIPVRIGKAAGLGVLGVALALLGTLWFFVPGTLVWDYAGAITIISLTATVLASSTRLKRSFQLDAAVAIWRFFGAIAAGFGWILLQLALA